MTYPLFASSKMASFWKWQFPATFVTQGAFATQSKKKQRLISLKNIHSVLERNEMEAWQKADSCIDT